MSGTEGLAVGPRGDKGERGERGLSRVQGRAVAVLFALAVVLGGANLFWTSHVVNVAAAAQHREQAAQQRAGAAVEEKLCTTLGRLAALAPPGGTAAGNPSRAYEQQLHKALSQLGPDIGCRRTP